MNETIYLINTTSQSVTSGNIVVLPVVARKLGCSLYASPSGIIAKKPGYYQATAKVIYSASTAGTATIQIYKDGVAIPGAIASATTTTTATTGTLTINIPTRVFCNESSPVYTLVSTGVDLTVANASLEVYR